MQGCLYTIGKLFVFNVLAKNMMAYYQMKYDNIQQ